MKTRHFFGLLCTICASLSTAWFAIWLGIELKNYKWDWSDNSFILSLQYLLLGLWVIVFCLSPAWWLWATTFSAEIFMSNKKD